MSSCSRKGTILERGGNATIRVTSLSSLAPWGGFALLQLTGAEIAPLASLQGLGRVEYG